MWCSLSPSVRFCTHFLLLLQAHTLSQTYRCFAMRVLRAYNYRPLLLFVYITCGIRPIPIYWWALLKLETSNTKLTLNMCAKRSAHTIFCFISDLHLSTHSFQSIEFKSSKMCRNLLRIVHCVDENWPGRKFVIKIMDQNKFFCCSVHLLIYILEFFWCVCSCAHFF